MNFCNILLHGANPTCEINFQTVDSSGINSRDWLISQRLCYLTCRACQWPMSCEKLSLAPLFWEKVTQAGVRAEYKLQRLEAVSSNPMIQTRVANRQEIKAFMAGTLERSIPIGLVPKDIKEHLGTSADVVLFSRYTADKQRKHPEITVDSFSWLQELLDNGARLYDKKHHATVIQHREHPYLAVLKSTSNGSEVYLQSFRRTDEKNLASLAKRVGGS